MFSLRDIVQPDNLGQAYEFLVKQKNNAVLGGTAFLRLGSKRIGTGIDLSKLQLDQIIEHNGFFEIGAMVTFRDLETHSSLKDTFDGILPKAVGNIIGVQFRNVVTVGGSVFSKYGFSDLLTALLALDTEVVLYKGGCMPLGEFLDKPYEKDLLTHIRIRKDERRASYQNLRISTSDYPVLTIAVSRSNCDARIIVGARPQRAKLAEKASEHLAQVIEKAKAQEEQTALAEGLSLKNEDLDAIAELVAQELNFGSNSRGSAEYRKQISKVLVKRGMTEVLACKSK